MLKLQTKGNKELVIFDIRKVTALIELDDRHTEIIIGDGVVPVRGSVQELLDKLEEEAGSQNLGVMLAEKMQDIMRGAGDADLEGGAFSVSMGENGIEIQDVDGEAGEALQEVLDQVAKQDKPTLN